MITQMHNGKIAAATLLCFLAAEQAAAMQFGGLLGRRSASQSESTNNCNTAGRSAGRSVLSGVLGGAASAIGIPTFLPVATFSDVLATEIACRLDPDEQEKAAEATVEATRSGEVGSTASWTSETRADVSGSSTVVARNTEANGATCMDVNDVIIVGGEETTVAKRMCRAPGASRFTLVA